MPRVTLSPTAVTNAGIAASGSRTMLQFALEPGSNDCLFCYGATFTEADSQKLRDGDMYVLENAPAQQAISFGMSPNSVIDVSTL